MLQRVKDWFRSICFCFNGHVKSAEAKAKEELEQVEERISAVIRSIRGRK